MRSLRVEFATAEKFQREHSDNLVNGGVFVETTETFELRENVEVDIVLLFCDTQVTLAGEVVHIVPPEMASAGGKPGVAIQFSYAPAEVAGRLEPLLAAGGVTAPPRRVDSGRRRAPRTPARVPVRIDGAGAAVQGTARNLSNSGVLVATPAGGIRVGQNVRIAVENPTTGEVLEIDGTVMREIASGGEVAAVGIQFDPADDERSGVELFLEQVQSIEHTRRLGGIEGPIDELGPQNLLQMFGNAAPAGTLVLRNGEEEGLIGFENKLLRYARLGSASGMKALVRMLSWEQGNFEFHASLEPMDEADAPLPLEAAIFEAVREMDETSRIDQSRMPRHATVVVVPDRDEGETLTKVESAVLDLARVGFTVQRIIDVIPDSDPEILVALESLVDRGIVRFDD